MLGSPPPDAGNFADVLRGAREAVERMERDARKKAAEIVQQAEQQAHKIVDDAESEAKGRAESILHEAEERARQMPTQLLPTLITQVDDARIMLGEIRQTMQRLLDERVDSLPQAAVESRPPAPASEQKAESADGDEEKPLHKPGAYTIVRGLRAQMVEEMMQGSNKGQPAAPVPPPPSPAPEQETSPAPQADPPHPPPTEEDTRRRWPF